MRFSIAVSIAGGAALWVARIYDQNGGIRCRSETGEEYKNWYVLVELSYLFWLALTTASAPLVVARRGSSFDRRWLAAFVVLHSVLGFAPRASLGYCG